MNESTQILPETAFAVAIIAGIAYAFIVFLLRYFDEDHGLTPFLVVGGNAMIILIVYLAAGLKMAALLFGVNVCIGVPMIVEYYIWRIRHKKKRRF